MEQSVGLQLLGLEMSWILDEVLHERVCFRNFNVQVSDEMHFRKIADDPTCILQCNRASKEGWVRCGATVSKRSEDWNWGFGGFAALSCAHSSAATPCLFCLTVNPTWRDFRQTWLFAPVGHSAQSLKTLQNCPFLALAPRSGSGSWNVKRRQETERCQKKAVPREQHSKGRRDVTGKRCRYKELGRKGASIEQDLDRNRCQGQREKQRCQVKNVSRQRDE